MTDVNPLLQNLKLPGRIFQLPSRGMFYKNGELASNITGGEIHIHAMSAMDEINMKNPDQLFSGDAVKEVFTKCANGILNPAQLLSKDVDAIMLFLRTVTYGPEYEFTTIHTCEDAKTHSYVANVDQMINDMKMVDPTTIEAMLTISLPNGQVVKLQPSRYQQVIDLIKVNENKKEISAKDQQENLKMMLCNLIESVDGISNKEQIAEWISAVEATAVNRIAEKIDVINDWGPSLVWKVQCKDCGEPFDVEIPINPVSFFTD